MTLYILFQEIKAGRVSLNSKFIISKHAASMQPSKLGLKPGSRIRVEDAIKALVVKSANDIAAAIAENIGRTEHAFAQRMTRTARYLGMTRTRFRNASGLPNAKQVTTARDMATLSLRIQRDFPRLYKYFKTRKFTYRGRTYYSYNKLLGRFKGTDGIKTGYTRASGYNLTTSVRRGRRHIIGVVMGAPSGGKRNAYMMSMLQKTIRKIPARKKSAIALVVGTPPGYKPQPKKQTVATPPVPKPKPPTQALTTQTVVPFPEPEPAPSGLVATTKPVVLKPVPAPQPVSPAQAAQPGWSIQIGAFTDEAEAKRRLALTQNLGLSELSGKPPLTIAFYKNDRLLYRARFSGFEQNEARSTCQELKRKSISCIHGWRRSRLVHRLLQAAGPWPG